MVFEKVRKEFFVKLALSAFKNKSYVRKGLKKGNLPKGKIYYNFFAHVAERETK